MAYTKKINDPITCPIQYAYDVFGGKWKSRVICALSRGGTLRFNQLRNEMVNITDPILSSTLKSLIESGLVHRETFNEVPPHVEYSLTEKGKSLIPVLQTICQWTNPYLVTEEGESKRICERCRYHGAK